MKDDQGRERGSRKTTLDETQVAACPECDRSTVQLRNQRDSMGPVADSKRYQCRGCMSTFDEFVVRKRKQSRKRRGLAGTLEDMDPSEISK